MQSKKGHIFADKKERERERECRENKTENHLEYDQTL